MLAYKKSLIALILTLSCSQGWAQKSILFGTSDDLENSKGQLNMTSVSVGFISWTEFLKLDNGISEVDAFSNLYGNHIAYEKETYSDRKGASLEAGVIFGQGNAVNTNRITYSATQKSWFGGMASYKLGYRFTPRIHILAGPVLLYRNIQFPTTNLVSTVESGSDFNVGAMIDLRFRLTREWEVRQCIGTLAIKASTIWNIGLGYKF